MIQPQNNGAPRELPQVSHDNALTDANLAAIAARLNALPPRQSVTLADAIKTLAPSIKRLRDRGYSNHEVAGQLTASGLKVSGRTLARLTATAKQEKSAKRSQS